MWEETNQNEILDQNKNKKKYSYDSSGLSPVVKGTFFHIVQV